MKQERNIEQKISFIKQYLERCGLLNVLTIERYKNKQHYIKVNSIDKYLKLMKSKM